MLADLVEIFDSVDAPPLSDRRLTRRMLDAWARTARGSFPSWGAMQRVDLGDDWNWAFVVDLRQSVGFPYFVYLGPRLAKLADVHLSGASDWTMSLLDKATSQIEAAARAAAPQFWEDELVLCDRRRIQFRSMTAPLADDGETISHVIGVANGRFVERALSI